MPWVAGWRLKQLRAARQGTVLPRFSKPALQDCIRQQGPALLELRQQVASIFRDTPAEEGLPGLNHKLMHLCSRLFPIARRTRTRPGNHPRVQHSIRTMWDAYRELKRCRRQTPAGSLFRVWKAYASFSRQWRTASRSERRRWLQEQIALAQEAACKHDMGEIYRIVRLLAPKQRKEPGSN